MGFTSNGCEKFFFEWRVIGRTLHGAARGGYVHQEFPGYVCKLKKVLYGLKQVPKAWTDRISRFL